MSIIVAQSWGCDHNESFWPLAPSSPSKRSIKHVSSAFRELSALFRSERSRIGTASLPQMDTPMKYDITFTRLTEVDPTDIIAHMSDPRVAEHMPLLTFEWDDLAVAKFVATKEACWNRDGLGHWAILQNGKYVGWGGFQKEGDEWDYGLVLKPMSFGLGVRISRKAIEFAVADERIPFVTFLLPPSRKSLGALKRLGATFVAEIEYDGSIFLKYRLNTEGSPRPA